MITAAGPLPKPRGTLTALWALHWTTYWAIGGGIRAYPLSAAENVESVGARGLRIERRQDEDPEEVSSGSAAELIRFYSSGASRHVGVHLAAFRAYEFACVVLLEHAVQKTEIAPAVVGGILHRT